LLTARDSLLVTFDYADAAVKGFSTSGALAWRTGRRGQAPGEFENAMDIELGWDGTVWIYDDGTNRITMVGRGGELKGVISSPGLMIKDIVPLRSGVIVTAVANDSSDWVALDSTGHRVSHGRFAGIPTVANPFAKQTIAAMGPDAVTWAVAYPWGDRLIVMRDTTPECSGQLVDATSFPRAPPHKGWAEESPIGAAAIAVGERFVFVLFKGVSDLALKVVDVYSVSDCKYRGSVRLGQRAFAIAYSDGVLYLAQESPAPTIVGLTLNDSTIDVSR
jgi:hypothetical protein